MEDYIELEPSARVVKSKLSRYRLVYPIKNKDGSINWFNLLTGGSWGNLLLVIGVVAFLCYLVWQYNQDISAAVECCNTACKSLVKTFSGNNIYNTPINFSIID